MSSVFVITEQRFVSIDNKVYSVGGGDKSFWERYLDVFDELIIVARVETTKEIIKSSIEIDNPRIKFLKMPYYTGIIKFSSKFISLLNFAKKEVIPNRTFILRCPGNLSSIFYIYLKIKNIPYCMEVVGDPYDSLSQKAIGYFYLMEPVRILSKFFLKWQCRNAFAISYVTKAVLQKRYPSNAIIKSNYSSIELNFSLIEDTLISEKSSIQTSLIFIGSLEQKYKGLHILLDAVQKLVYENKISVKLKIIGDGKFRKQYEKQAIDLKIDNHVSFVGYVTSGREIFSHLYSADLFVMPSLVEGLPRAMIEAMACGLVCLGSKTGGIPELLSEEFMFTSNNSQSLVERILFAIKLNKTERKNVIETNKSKALEYDSNALKKTRNIFYTQIKENLH